MWKSLPALPGVTTTSQNYQTAFVSRPVDVRQDLRGRAYYWIGGPEAEAEDVPGSDMSAVKGGRASVTPLMLDLTDQELLDRVRGWQLADFDRHEGPARAVLEAEEATGIKLKPPSGE
jgi:broad specificity polyphosphatase/5'/3'-nucleotidase SurE